MHVITQKRIWEAKQQYPTAASALDSWYRIIKKNRFANFAELKHTFKSVDKVGNFYVFNVGGNKIRLIANIQFLTQRVYIRHILMHNKYDSNKRKL